MAEMVSENDETTGCGMRPRMIFHVPFPLDPDAKSASGIRPMRLRRAFEAIGYEVLEISGRHPERQTKIAELKREIAHGLKIDFVYSEAATPPTGIGEPITLATSFTRDIRFLRYCRRAGIPVGLFYRDIYWQFEEYAKRVGQPYTAILRWRYRADLRGYRSAVDRIYLPSMRMADYLPKANRPQAAALPPGADRIEAQSPDGPLSLFYVGGIGGYYRLQEAVRGVELASDARLTLCSHEDQWKASADEYVEMLGPSTRVVHRSGPELEELYEETHVGMLFMEPIEYREFAAPMKLYEYLGHGKPIIATEGSLAGSFVEENGIGWALPYDAEVLAELLDQLAEDPAMLSAKAQQARNVRGEHTWEARAAHVAQDLSGAVIISGRVSKNN